MENLFRNLIAYEQCEPTDKSKMISYAMLLDGLIKCDMKIYNFLLSKRIIENYVGDDISLFIRSSVFNSVGPVLHSFYDSKLYEDLNAHFLQSIQMGAKLLHNYLGEPW